MRRVSLLVLLGACGGDDAAAPDAAVVDPPEATCDAPALVDVTTPDTIVTDCTEAGLRAAAAGGGTIVFDCGDATITVTAPIVVTADTVIDGGGTITLSGGGTSRILYLDSDYNTATPWLVVQRLTFVQGQAPAGGEDTAQGGGAIYRDGGSVTVLDCTFDDNHAPLTGQDVAGGAIYAFGGGDLIIAGSTFTGNTASDGGAVGSLNGDLTIINTTFVGNHATGTDGNPGNGGAGGAIYQDGGDEATSLCGVTVRDNTAGAIGGGVFRVSNSDDGRYAIDRSTFDHNVVTPAGDGNAGGLYLQGLALTITASTISRNEAFYNGGLWINECAAELENVTIAENVAKGSNGGGVWLGNSPTGSMRNVTIANNHSTADGQIAGAIFGGGLTLYNTVIANNTAMYTPGCDDARADGSGNLQWPDGALCTTAPLVADPALGALGDHGGDTETLEPAAASPARGLGTDCPATDQRGEPRGEPCTAGAVE